MLPQASSPVYRAIQFAIVVCGAYFVFALLFSPSEPQKWPRPSLHLSKDGFRDPKLEHIQNDTLGFEHIYAIGLKERTDKRDFLNLAASVTGIKVQWVDGVHIDELEQKALPVGYNLSTMVPSIIACWRAHMNALNRYSTALIMEDDADWDLNIKSQLTEFARGLHALKANASTDNAPYGTAWDVLWIGGCSSTAGVNETEFYVIPNDPTVPSFSRRHTWSGPEDRWVEMYPEESTRFVYKAERGCCTFGYAVTQRGARKILAALSLDHVDVPVDIAMAELCGGENGRDRLECYAPYPNIVGTFRQGGPAYRNSDIVSNDDQSLQVAHSENMVYSSRLNIHRVLAGKPALSQWEEEAPWSPKELPENLEEFPYPRGYLVNELDGE
ncbi:hypothetical protein N7470_000039 [Penicillium chermesinum]|nr:hypothetical protein N7470_000039 [Penicillium chermesinum]